MVRLSTYAVMLIAALSFESEDIVAETEPAWEHQSSVYHEPTLEPERGETPLSSRPTLARQGYAYVPPESTVNFIHRSEERGLEEKEGETPKAPASDNATGEADSASAETTTGSLLQKLDDAAKGDDAQTLHDAIAAILGEMKSLQLNAIGASPEEQMRINDQIAQLKKAVQAALQTYSLRGPGSPENPAPPDSSDRPGPAPAASGSILPPVIPTPTPVESGTPQPATPASAHAPSEAVPELIGGDSHHGGGTAFDGSEGTGDFGESGARTFAPVVNRAFAPPSFAPPSFSPPSANPPPESGDFFSTVGSRGDGSRNPNEQVAPTPERIAVPAAPGVVSLRTWADPPPIEDAPPPAPEERSELGPSFANVPDESRRPPEPALPPFVSSRDSEASTASPDASLPSGTWINGNGNPPPTESVAALDRPEAAGVFNLPDSDEGTEEPSDAPDQAEDSPEPIYRRRTSANPVTQGQFGSFVREVRQGLKAQPTPEP